MVKNSKPKLNLLVKKRNNQWANEVYVATDCGELRFLTHGDRYIPRRCLLCNIERNSKCLNKEKSEDAFLTKLSSHHWRQHRFSLVFNNSFGIKERRILNFSDERSNSSSIFLNNKSEQFIYGRWNGYDWSCKPRLKPLAYADATHDLPGFDFSSDLNMVDWSINGQIAASFGRDLVVWKRREHSTMMFNIKCCRAISYCPNGDFLAIGSKSESEPVLEIWNVKQLSEFNVVNSYYFHKKYFNILSIAWSRSGKEIVCGTQLGAIFVFTVPKLNISHKIQKHNFPVTIIKFSPTMRYLACGDIEGNISIFNWNTCDTHCHIRSRRKRKISFDWHPWNDVDLAISQENPALIVILHVPSAEMVAYYQRKDKMITIDTVTFSKLTGELLVSVTELDTDGCTYSEIIVMSAIDHVVDVLRIPESGARFMMWSPDGTQLASAGHDETLTFWNFYTEKNNKKLSNKLKSRYKNFKQPFDFSFGMEFSMWSSLK